LPPWRRDCACLLRKLPQQPGREGCKTPAQKREMTLTGTAVSLQKKAGTPSLGAPAHVLQHRC
jgi:hypothetical protein